MTVFKGFMLMVKRNINIVIMYTVIFCGISIAVQLAAGGDAASEFEEKSLNIAVIDRDQSSLSENLKEYLGEKHNIVDVKDDKKVIQEEMFYRNIYYVAVIPENFQNDYLTSGKKVKTTKLPGTSSAFYVDQQIDTFLNSVKVLSASGFEIEEAIAGARDAADTETAVTLIDKNGNGGVMAPHTSMFRFLPYIVLAAVSYIVSIIMMQFRKKEIRRRMLCAAVPSRKQNAQLVLGVLIMGICIWVACILLALGMYPKAFLGDSNKIYYMMNALCMTLVALAIAILMGMVMKNEVAVNGVVNVVSLGMCFTCGVFVSLDMLGTGVKTVSQFLPVYWYEVVNDTLANNVDFTRFQQLEIYKGYGIQILFAVAIFGIGLSVSKYMERE